MRRVTTIILLVALLAPALSWYVCDEVPFCSRIRYSDASRPTYSASDVEVAGMVSGKLVNDGTSEEFVFQFSSLVDGRFRLTVQDPQKSRYTPENDALDGVPQEVPLVRKSNDGKVLVVSTGDDNIIVNINFKPFQIEVVENGVPIVEVNKAQRLVINTDDEDPSVAIDVSFPQANDAYGIPLHAERLSLPTTKPGGLTPYRFFNIDNGQYPSFTREPLYGTIAVLYGVGTQHTSGAFWMNGAQTFIDINNEGSGVDALFISEAGALELFLFAGPTLKDCVRGYTKLTGRFTLPQYFILGYHQSRYSYMSQEDVETVVEEFDKNSFPLDVMWLDIDYTDGYKYFTWNYDTFPNPIGMQDKLASKGRKIVAISDPHIKKEEGYFAYDQGVEGDFFVKNPDGSIFYGECWPGVSAYVDYFNPAAQEWYGNLYLPENFANSTLNLYIWNDMNEPSVFDTEEHTMPANSIHHGGILHRDIHNMYGFKQTQATHAGLIKRDPNRRPFILTRSHFAGSQRYTAMWTGDNEATWIDLRISIPMVLTESMGGIALCGADVAGFVGNPTDELYQRWYQVGAWYPFFRGHSDKGSVRREPYLYPNEIQERVRKTLKLRYKHIPYWYTLFFEHEAFGDPVVRPVSYHYSDDAKTLGIDEQWLIGSDIMAAPVLYEGADSVVTYFPGQEYWYDLESCIAYAGGKEYEIAVTLDSLLHYYRAGSIVVTIDDVVSSTEDQRNSNLTVNVFLDSEGKAYGRYFIDDLESFKYRDGLFNYYELLYDEATLTVDFVHGLAGFDVEKVIDTVKVYSVKEGSSPDGVQEIIYKENIKLGRSGSVTKLE